MPRAMESIRRCHDCRRVVHGEAGNACPYCGCAKLNRLEEHGVPAARLHIPVLRLALAFCMGLALMQLLLLWPDFNLSAGRALPFWQLNLVLGVCMLAYVILRRVEGDFR